MKLTERLEEKIERGLQRWRDKMEQLDGDKLGDSDPEGEEMFGTASESESDSWDRNIEKFIQEETGWDENIDKFIQAETQGVIEQCLDGLGAQFYAKFPLQFSPCSHK